MIKWAVTVLVNRLMIAGFVLVAVNGLHGPRCEASSSVMGQIDRAILGWKILGWKEIIRAPQDAP